MTEHARERLQEKRRGYLGDVPEEFRGHIAENMKERVYATITLIAVITALWQSAEHHTVAGAVASIVGSTVALWLATWIAASLSHRAVFGESLRGAELRRHAFASSGLFAPMVAPVAFVLLSLTGVIELKNALLIGMVALLLSLFLLSFSATRRLHQSTSRVLLFSLVEVLIGVGVIALKLATGE